MGHVHVVIKGNKIVHLMKRPSAAERRNALKAKSVGVRPPPLPKLVASPQSRLARIENTQKGLSDKINVLKDLDQQHNAWLDHFSAYQTALWHAEQNFGVIMGSKTPDSLLAAIMISVLTTLVFVVAPEIGPIKGIAEKLAKSDAVVKTIASAICESGKTTLEQFQKHTENANVGDEKLVGQKMTLKYFGKLHDMLSHFTHVVTAAHKVLSDRLDTGDPSELAVIIPAVRAGWAQAGLELKDTSEIDANQLGLLLLYEVMRQYTKDNVSLVIEWVKAGDTVGPAPGTAGSLEDNAKYALDLMAAKPKSNVPITKAEFKRRRRENPEFDVEFVGLDSARRAAMYDCFSGIRWHVRDYPRIVAPPEGRGWLDMIDAESWKFKSG
jgi:hypothetical protein